MFDNVSANPFSNLLEVCYPYMGKRGSAKRKFKAFTAMLVKCIPFLLFDLFIQKKREHLFIYIMHLKKAVHQLKHCVSNINDTEFSSMRCLDMWTNFFFLVIFVSIMFRTICLFSFLKICLNNNSSQNYKQWVQLSE